MRRLASLQRVAQKVSCFLRGRARDIFGFTSREVLLGIIAGAAGGLSVLVAVLRQSATNVVTQVIN
jgi:hypothetical protein